MAPRKGHKYDAFIESSKVSGLMSQNFHEYLSDHQVAFVMFYDPKCPRCHLSKPHFIRAAHTTKRDGHGFAAVDCSMEPDLCREELVNSFPSFKLYSKGRYVGQYGHQLDYQIMKKYVENSPVASRLPSKDAFD